MSDISASVASLAELRAAGQAKFGDYLQAYNEAGDYARMRHPIRLDSEVRKQLADIPKRIDEVQSDKPEVAEARAKLNAAINRRDTAPEDASTRVQNTHQERVDEAQAALDAAIAAHQPSEDEQMDAVRNVVHEMIRLAVAEPEHAQGLIDALGTDIPNHIALVERYMGKVQMGEASPSAS